MSRRHLILFGSSLILFGSSAAHASAFGRPTEIGARAIGMGGAFTAVADDPSALWHNPAGLVTPVETQVMLDDELLVLDREWTRSDKNVRETTDPQLVPFVGASTRFGFGGRAPSRLAVGVAFYNSYGGAISMSASDLGGCMPSTCASGTAVGITSTSLLLLEIAPAVAYQVSDALSLGLALRIGIGSFSVVDTEPAFSGGTAANPLSAVGVGLGASLSAMVRPHDRVAIGALYRSAITTNMSGSGPIAVAGGPATTRSFDLDVTWPQSASLGVAVRPTRWLRLALQGDWVGWSSLQALTLDLHSSATQSRPLKLRDAATFHLGGEATFGRVAVRLGGALDTSAVPDEAIRRENRDGLKVDVAGGLGVRVSHFVVDAAVDLVYAPARTFTNTPPLGEPGTYSALVATFSLAATARF